MTRRFNHTLGMIPLVVALTIGITAAVAQQSRSQAGEVSANRAPPCSIATIVGGWGFRAMGKTPDGFDVAAVGTFAVSSDGQSSFRGWTYVNRPGGLLAEFSDSGTIAVNPDCTGTQVWSGRPDDPAKVVITANGNEIWAVYTKRLSTVTLKRISGLRGQGPSPCSITTIAGEWGYRSTAKTPDGFDVVSTGTYVAASDGKSSFRGWTYANRPGGLLTEVSDSGTITVNPDCTGTQVWSGRPDDPAKVVITANGNEIWAVYTKRLSTVTLNRIGGLPSQTSSAAFPKGTYTTELTREDISGSFSPQFIPLLVGRWETTFAEDGRHAVVKDGEAVVNGRYAATQSQVVLYGDKGPLACDILDRDPRVPPGTPAATHSGVYTWTFDGKTLSFTKMVDECDGRVVFFTAHPLAKRR